MSQLAKLADLKVDGKITGTETDAQLTRCIEDASATAAQLAGVDTLVRTSTTLYPFDPAAPGSGQTRTLRVHKPIESITSIKQRYDQGESWDDVDALTADTDYLVAFGGGVSGGGGKIERINAVWYVGRRQLVQVTGVFGYDNPDDPSGLPGAITPPADLQRGVREQAMWLARRGSIIGTDSINLGRGGAANFKDMEVVESLRQAVANLPFVRLM